MNQQFVICDNGLLEASLVPDILLGPPGQCPHGVYETILLKDGRPVAWQEHWTRFADGIKYLGKTPPGIATLATPDAVYELAVRNGHIHDISRLRIQVFHEPQIVNGNQINFLAKTFAADRLTKNPFAVSISKVRRTAADASYNYKLMGRRDAEDELAEARARGIDDVLFLNSEGDLCEAVYANLWIFAGSVLYTPPLDAPCLPGVTRGKILGAAHLAGIPVVSDRALKITSLAAADQIFLTSSIRGIQMVSTIEDLWQRPHEREEVDFLTILAQNL